jgi:hypothetical protein
MHKDHDGLSPLASRVGLTSRQMGQSARRDLSAATAGLMQKLRTRDVSHTCKANRGLLSSVSQREPALESEITDEPGEWS